MFPPPTIATGDQADEMKAKELQICSLEKQAILDFEMHLAAATNKATITESNSLLLAQLISLDPASSFRRPPQAFLDQLQQANQVTMLLISSFLNLAELVAFNFSVILRTRWAFPLSSLEGARVDNFGLKIARKRLQCGSDLPRPDMTSIATMFFQ